MYIVNSSDHLSTRLSKEFINGGSYYVHSFSACACAPVQGYPRSLATHAFNLLHSNVSCMTRKVCS